MPTGRGVRALGSLEPLLSQLWGAGTDDPPAGLHQPPARQRGPGLCRPPHRQQVLPEPRLPRWVPAPLPWVPVTAPVPVPGSRPIPIPSAMGHSPVPMSRCGSQPHPCPLCHGSQPHLHVMPWVTAPFPLPCCGSPPSLSPLPCHGSQPPPHLHPLCPMGPWVPPPHPSGPDPAQAQGPGGLGMSWHLLSSPQQQPSPRRSLAPPPQVRGDAASGPLTLGGGSGMGGCLTPLADPADGEPSSRARRRGRGGLRPLVPLDPLLQDLHPPGGSGHQEPQPLLQPGWGLRRGERPAAGLQPAPLRRWAMGGPAPLRRWAGRVSLPHCSCRGLGGRSICPPSPRLWGLPGAGVQVLVVPAPVSPQPPPLARGSPVPARIAGGRRGDRGAAAPAAAAGGCSSACAPTAPPGRGAAGAPTSSAPTPSTASATCRPARVRGDWGAVGGTTEGLTGGLGQGWEGWLGIWGVRRAGRRWGVWGAG